MSSEKYPILVTRELIIFPNNSVPLTVASRRNKKAIKAALSGSGRVLVIPVEKGTKTGEATPQDLYNFGTLCKVEQSKGSNKDSFQVLLNGLIRAELSESSTADEDQDLLLGCYKPIETEVDIDDATLEQLLTSGKGIAVEILKLSQGSGSKKLSELVQSLDDSELFVNLCAAHLDLTLNQKMLLLQTPSIRVRLLKILDLLHIRKNSLQVQVELGQKLGKQMDRKQREVILREQLQAIREELGDLSEGDSDLNFVQKINELPMPEEVKKVARDEAKRLESTPSASPEAPNIRNYLDLLCELPWGQPKAKDIDIVKARELLDREHHGLVKVKDRIIQHLAVMQLNKGQRGTILLLVGPPGVGKTSLGKSIATAMERKFVRVSLGGIRDEAEIRGHRRTYLGSMPGRIIQGIKRAGTNNPVFLLDEIDKLSQGWAGDPASALLEALDPEQNNTFEDHYMDVPYDLSHVVFIATANSLEGIPAPLRDRMEIINLSGYTTAEKLFIAKKHLWPEEIEKHGLAQYKLSIAEDALLHLITHYTKESGVRELKRKIAALCRNLSEQVLRQTNEDSIKITIQDLEKTLGPEPYSLELTEASLPPGVVTGLAWTPLGGEILFIESKLMPGSGKLTITGQLGDVMKESLQIAMSHVRAHLNKINPRFQYDKFDIHVHVPSGAIPKDGPSAGITMLSSLVSLIAQKRVESDIAMSGEITLRGTVLPVGGIKEKVIAAHRAGVKKVLLSAKNKKDLHEVPVEVRKELDIIFVETAEEVIEEGLKLNFTFDDVFKFNDLALDNPPPLLS